MPTPEVLRTPEAVLAYIRPAKTVAVCGHINPDGDAIGSGIALTALLRAMGLKATHLLAQDKPAPRLYDFLSEYTFTPACQYTGTPDLFIAVDSPGGDRIGDGLEVLKRAGRSLVIDHHPDYVAYSDAYFGDSQASGTASLIWQVIQASGIAPTQAMADACYVGIMTDTGRFAFQNTSEQTLTDAAQMVAAGADPSALSQAVYDNKSLPGLQLESRTIDRMRFGCNGRVVYSWISEDDLAELGLTHDDAEGLPTLLRGLQGIHVAALLRAENNKVRVNLRSRNGVDVGAFARTYGGGGHAAAAGITLDMGLSEALETFIPALTALECAGGGQ